jgi:hypothetical protein
MRVAYLTDDHITYLADYAAHIRHHPGRLPHGDGAVVPAA